MLIRKLMAIAMMISTSLLLVACGGDDESAVDISEVDAEKLYQQKCSVCHGRDLKGDSAADLSQIGSKYSKEEIEEIIIEGISSMPKKLYKGVEAEAIAEWLSTMK